MTVFDAYALIALLADEVPAADLVERELCQVDDSPFVSAVNLAEVIDRAVRVAGASEMEITSSVDLLLSDRLTVVPADEQIGRLAGVLRTRHYHHASCPVSLADCMAVATALVQDQRLATSDPALARVARANHVDLLPLPDSRGRLP